MLPALTQDEREGYESCIRDRGYSVDDFSCNFAFDANGVETVQITRNSTNKVRAYRRNDPNARVKNPWVAQFELDLKKDFY